MKSSKSAQQIIDEVTFEVELEYAGLDTKEIKQLLIKANGKRNIQ